MYSEGAVQGWNLVTGALREVGLSHMRARNDEATQTDEGGSQLYKLGYCSPSVAESGAPASSSFAAVLNFASLSDFFASMASRRAAARALASDIVSLCFLARSGAPSAS